MKDCEYPARVVISRWVNPAAFLAILKLRANISLSIGILALPFFFDFIFFGKSGGSAQTSSKTLQFHLGFSQESLPVFSRFAVDTRNVTRYYSLSFLGGKYDPRRSSTPRNNYQRTMS